MGLWISMNVTRTKWEMHRRNVHLLQILPEIACLASALTAAHPLNGVKLLVQRGYGCLSKMLALEEGYQSDFDWKDGGERLQAPTSMGPPMCDELNCYSFCLDALLFPPDQQSGGSSRIRRSTSSR